MKKKHLTLEEREDIQMVMEATHRLLPVYEQLNAADNLNEEEQLILEQIQQTLEDVLEFSGLMIEQIQVLQFENAIDQRFVACQKNPDGQSEEQSSGEEAQNPLVEYLKASTERKLN